MAGALGEITVHRSVRPETAARLALAIGDVTVRDDLIARVVTDRETSGCPR